VARATWILTGSPENHAATRERGDALRLEAMERRRTGVAA